MCADVYLLSSSSSPVIAHHSVCEARRPPNANAHAAANPLVKAYASAHDNDDNNDEGEGEGEGDVDGRFWKCLQCTVVNDGDDDPVKCRWVGGLEGECGIRYHKALRLGLAACLLDCQTVVRLLSHPSSPITAHHHPSQRVRGPSSQRRSPQAAARHGQRRPRLAGSTVQPRRQNPEQTTQRWRWRWWRWQWQWQWQWQ